jgi:hypothetical protein
MSISQSIKIRLYKTIIRPAVTYGAEKSKIEKNVNDMWEKDIDQQRKMDSGELELMQNW